MNKLIKLSIKKNDNRICYLHIKKNFIKRLGGFLKSVLMVGILNIKNEKSININTLVFAKKIDKKTL